MMVLEAFVTLEIRKENVDSANELQIFSKV